MLHISSNKYLGSGLRALFDDSIGLIDCYPSCNCAVIIAQECHLVNEIEMKQKIKKLSKVSTLTFA